MERKNTDQLQQELMTGNDLDRVLADNDSSFQGYALQERLQALFQRREISKTALARQSGILARGQLDPGTGDVVLGVEGLSQAPGALTLRLAYATRATHDQQVEMHALPGGGRFAGQLGNRLRPGAWTVTLEPAGGAWRVSGRVVVDKKAERLELLLAP